MIDKEILDQVIPLPELDELRDRTITELQEEGFAITNFHSGGIFYTILMAVLRIELELTGLARMILNNLFVAHAAGAWLDLKSGDFTKKRKAAQKARGVLTLTREDGWTDAVKIDKGHIFKTLKDIVGDELRYFVVEAAVLRKGEQTVEVLVEAEKEGARYNVPEGQITKSLTVLAGIGNITNGPNWIRQEGSDTEDDESLRGRSLRSWSELAKVPLSDTYRNACSEIPGVLYVAVKDQHPRGQGTVDIIITSEAGAATDDLLEKCRNVVEGLKEPDSDVLVKSAEVVTQDVEINVTMPSGENQEGIIQRVETSLVELFQLRKRKRFNELTHADIIFKVKSDVGAIENVTVISPSADIFLAQDKVILLGAVTVNVEEV